LIVKIVEQLGEQLVAKNEPLTLRGRPETLNDTNLDVPESKAVLMLVAAVDAWPTDKSPGRVREKSKFCPDPPIPEILATSVGFRATLKS
jgi:hypothetical protein